MSDLLKNAFFLNNREDDWGDMHVWDMLKYISEVQGVDDKAVGIGAYPLMYVRDEFKTQGMCIREVEEDPWELEFVPDHF